MSAEAVHAWDGQSVADVMLADPKTVRGDASVAEVRELFGNRRVQMVLLADGTRFRGAITSLPDDAPSDAPALSFAEPAPEVISADEPAASAYERACVTPSRRIVVLGEDETLLGLVCLDKSKTHFCGH